jgi:hypothetical protein
MSPTAAISRLLSDEQASLNRIFGFATAESTYKTVATTDNKRATIFFIARQGADFIPDESLVIAFKASKNLTLPTLVGQSIQI